MANGDTKTNQYLDIAANGNRADLPSDTCCETRTQTLIRGVAERIMNVEDEVERLENNPDVVDIVDTYADLQEYDTSGLTDKDIIRVIADETKDGLSSYYRWNSPDPGWNFVGVIPGGEEGVTVLTEADYNYPADNPNKIAVWLLEPGVYTWGSYTARNNTSFANNEPVSFFNNTFRASTITMIIGYGSYTGQSLITCIGDNGRSSAEVGGYFSIMRYTIFNKNDTTTSRIGNATYNRSTHLVSNEDIVNNLTSTSTYEVLSAAQGKVLNDKIGNLANLTTTDKTSAVAAINELASSGGGGVTKLSSNDYDYPTSNPTGIALWNLDSGLYFVPGGVTAYGNMLEASAGQNLNGHCLVYVEKEGSTSTIISIGNGNGTATGAYGQIYSTMSPMGMQLASDKILFEKQFGSRLGGLSFVSLSQTAYDALSTKDPNTLYIITGA